MAAADNSLSERSYEPLVWMSTPDGMRTLPSMPVSTQRRSLELTLPSGQRFWDEDIVNASEVCRSLRKLLRRQTIVYRRSNETLVWAVERAADRGNALELVLKWRMLLGSMRTAFTMGIPSSRWYRQRDATAQMGDFVVRWRMTRIKIGQGRAGTYTRRSVRPRRLRQGRAGTYKYTRCSFRPRRLA